MDPVKSENVVPAPVDHAAVVAKAGSDLVNAMTAHVLASLEHKRTEAVFIAARTAWEKSATAAQDAQKKHRDAIAAWAEAKHS